VTGLDNDELEFYTYAFLREDGTPYYIGKGSGMRYKVKTGRMIPPPEKESRIIKLKENLTEEEAFRHEIYMIAVLPNLRNLTSGGEGVSGLKHTDKTKRILSEKAKRPRSEESKKKQSETIRKRGNHFQGKEHTEEARAKMRKPKNNRKGYSLDWKERQRQNQLGRIWVNDGVRNYKIHPEELNTYLTNGLVRGRTYHPRKQSK